MPSKVEDAHTLWLSNFTPRYHLREVLTHNYRQHGPGISLAMLLAIRKKDQLKMSLQRRKTEQWRVFFFSYNGILGGSENKWTRATQLQA